MNTFRSEAMLSLYHTIITCYCSIIKDVEIVANAAISGANYRECSVQNKNGLQDKGLAIKGLVVLDSWDLRAC